ncbi:hypothetical protein [Inquilinus limosus]|uniref:Uncharacterized protein n=1 Tax=Inquilinus limosus TaxID=171674 RepID=A0A211ZKL2_9PROT|nr:hypothetical protein [Inquilinus limosus]OWJ65790.1 hypothetical protein BWR60_18065 [Inquilinus limosus]
MDTIGPLTQQIHNDLLALIGERSEDYAAEAGGDPQAVSGALIGALAFLTGQMIAAAAEAGGVAPLLERASANMRVGAEAGIAPVETIDTGVTVH